MAKPSGPELMEKIVALCKRRGFIYPASDIYGGINGFWDYGPLGVQLKNNLRDAWWRDMVECPPSALMANLFKLSALTPPLFKIPKPGSRVGTSAASTIRWWIVANQNAGIARTTSWFINPPRAQGSPLWRVR